MPSIKPLAEAVSWSADELAIGVVGVAPWATLEFCRALYGLIDASKDWHYPRLLIDANSKIPSRGRHLELGETDPSPLIRQTIVELIEAGASVVVVPCNTAHLLYLHWSQGLTVPVPHIMEVSVDRVVALGGRSLAVLESKALWSSGAYQAAARARGLEIVSLDGGEVEEVAGLIEAIKVRAQPSDVGREVFSRLSAGLVARGADSILLGCTELGVFAPAAALRDCIVVDSNQELARAAAVLARCALRPEFR